MTLESHIPALLLSLLSSSAPVTGRSERCGTGNSGRSAPAEPSPRHRRNTSFICACRNQSAAQTPSRTLRDIPTLSADGRHLWFLLTLFKPPLALHPGGAGDPAGAAPGRGGLGAAAGERPGGADTEPQRRGGSAAPARPEPLPLPEPAQSPSPGPQHAVAALRAAAAAPAARPRSLTGRR